MKKNFWSEKKVFVTGANGFVGSNLTYKLKEEGANIIVLVQNKNSPNPLFQSFKDDIEIIEGDIRDFEKIAGIFQEKNIDTCFHLSAQPIVSLAFNDPLPTFMINIQGTINILESARRTGKVQRLVIASTTHVYGENKNLPYLESYFPQPTRPYETSKACADILAQTYYYSYGLPVAISRSTNTYGPGDLNFSRIVPKTTRSVLEHHNPEIVGGTSKRDYIFVEDSVDAYLTLAEQLDKKEVQGQAFNFGGGKVFSGIDIAETILKVNNDPSLQLSLLPDSEERKKEIEKQFVSIEKAKKMLDWEPKHSLEQGIQKTLAWYKNNLPNISS